METEIIKIRPGEGPVSEEDEEKLRAAGAILQQGGLGLSLPRPCTGWGESTESFVFPENICGKGQTVRQPTDRSYLSV